MPPKEPAPEVGIAEQPGPKVCAPASDAIESELLVSLLLLSLGIDDMLVLSDAEALVSSLFPQAARPMVAVRARAASPPVRRRVLLFMILRTFRWWG